MAQIERANFGSRIGVILATAGSAVGLGNVWRFPYMAGENGGAAFILFYILCVVLLGLPCIMSLLLVAILRPTLRGHTALSRVAVHGSMWVISVCSRVFSSRAIMLWSLVGACSISMPRSWVISVAMPTISNNILPVSPMILSNR